MLKLPASAKCGWVKQRLAWHVVPPASPSCASKWGAQGVQPGLLLCFRSLPGLMFRGSACSCYFILLISPFPLPSLLVFSIFYLTLKKKQTNKTTLKNQPTQNNPIKKPPNTLKSNIWYSYSLVHSQTQPRLYFICLNRHADTFRNL